MNFVEQHHKEYYEDWLDDYDNWKVYKQAKELIGKLPKPFLDQVMYTYQSPQHYQIMVAAELACKVLEGHILWRPLRVGAKPRRDTAADFNDDALKHLPEGFEGSFWGGPGGPDGYISTDETILFSVNALPHEPNFKRKVLRYAHFPLEVGYCSPSQCWNRLYVEDGYLARWCYGYEDIHLFYATDYRREDE